MTTTLTEIPSELIDAVNQAVGAAGRPCQYYELDGEGNQSNHCDNEAEWSVICYCTVGCEANALEEFLCTEHADEVKQHWSNPLCLACETIVTKVEWRKL